MDVRSGPAHHRWLLAGHSELQRPQPGGKGTTTQCTAEPSGSEPRTSIPSILPGDSLQLSNHRSGLGAMFPARPLPASRGLPCPWPCISQSWASGQPAALGPTSPALQALGSDPLFASEGCLGLFAEPGGLLGSLGLGLQGRGREALGWFQAAMWGGEQACSPSRTCAATSPLLHQGWAKGQEHQPNVTSDWNTPGPRSPAAVSWCSPRHPSRPIPEGPSDLPPIPASHGRPLHSDGLHNSASPSRL